MEDFQKTQRHRANSYWVDPISKEDIDTLPLILLGLNYRKYFPQPVPEKYFSKKFLEQHPDIVFSRSKFTDKTMATGIRESDLVNMIQFGYHEYKEEEGDFIHPPVKVDFSPSNQPEQTISHNLQGTNLSNLSKVEHVLLQNQVEIITIEDDDDEPELINQNSNDSVNIREVIQRDLPYIDEGTLSIINTIQIQDQKVHTGQDEDTIALINKLEEESELEQRNYDEEKQEKLKKNLVKTEPIFQG